MGLDRAQIACMHVHIYIIYTTACNSQLEVSVEVAYMNGDLRLLIRRYDIDNGLLVDYTQSPTAAIM